MVYYVCQMLTFCMKPIWFDLRKQILKAERFWLKQLQFFLVSNSIILTRNMETLNWPVFSTFIKPKAFSHLLPPKLWAEDYEVKTYLISWEKILLLSSIACKVYMRSKALKGSILRFSHIRNIWKYGGRSCFCMNVRRVLQNDEKLAFGDWKSYSHWLGNCSDSSSMAHLATYVSMLKIAILANFLRLRKASIDHFFTVIIFHLHFQKVNIAVLCSIFQSFSIMCSLVHCLVLVSIV